MYGLIVAFIGIYYLISSYFVNHVSWGNRHKEGMLKDE